MRDALIESKDCKQKQERMVKKAFDSPTNVYENIL